MKIKNVTREQIQMFNDFKQSRDKKNEGKRGEDNGRKVLNVAFPELTQKLVEFSFMHNSKPVATYTSNPRWDIDRAKLQTEFPEAYKACYLEGKAWTLDVFI